MGCTIKIVTLPLDFNGPFSGGIFMLMAELAQMESDLKSEHIKAYFKKKKRDDPTWKMHGNIKDTVSDKVKAKSGEVYEMMDKGKTIRYISEMLGLSTSCVQKLKRMRGKELPSRRAEYAAKNPGWHLKKK